MSSILSLDLGTKTGWALATGNQLVGCGTVRLCTDKERKEWKKSWPDLRAYDPRPGILARWVKSKLESMDPAGCHTIIFEDVQFSSYTYQVQLWASLRTAVWLAASYAAPMSVTFKTIAVGTLKKAATGHGGATKDMMGAAARRLKFTAIDGLDDNAIDALHLLRTEVPDLCEKHA